MKSSKTTTQLPASVLTSPVMGATVINPVAPRYENPTFAITAVVAKGPQFSEVKVVRPTWNAITPQKGEKLPLIGFDKKRTETLGNAWVFKFEVNGKKVDVVSARRPNESTGYSDTVLFVANSDVPKFMASDEGTLAI